jgi:hypothetical protein
MKRKPPNFRPFLVNILLCVTIIGLFSIFTALPFFWTGIWFQTTPVLICLNLCSAISSLIIIVLTIKKDRIILSIFLSPIMLVFLGFLIWAGFVHFWAKFLALSFFGHPGIGEGFLFYLNLYIFLASFLYLMRFPVLRQKIIFSVLAVCILLSVTYILGEAKSPFKPFWFKEYLAFYALVLFFAPFILLSTHKNAVFVSCIVTSLILMYLSNNKSVIFSFIFILPIVFYLIRMNKNTAYRLSLTFSALFIIPFLIPFLIKILIPFLQNKEHVDYIAQSLSWRDQSTQILLRDAVLHPFNLFFGAGFGHFGDIFIQQADIKNLTGWDGTNWDEMHRANIHSHHFLMEIFHATGFVGLFLFMSFLIFIVLQIKKSVFVPAACFLVLFLVLSSTWFMAPGFVPLLAALLGGFMQIKLRIARHVSVFFIPLMILIFMVLSSATKNRLYIADFENKSMHNAQILISSDLYAGYPFALLLRSFIANLRHGIDEKRLNLFVQDLDSKNQKESLFQIALLDLQLRAELAYLIQSFKIPRSYDVYLQDWEKRLKKFLQKAPLRTELIEPFEVWLKWCAREDSNLRPQD